MIKWMTITFAAIPLLGWLLSLPFNYFHFGTPFTACGDWNNFLLWEATVPCWDICDILAQSSRLLQKHPYVTVTLYALVCAILYALAGFLLGLFMRACIYLVRKYAARLARCKKSF
jgi:hypothetical protein